MLALGSAASPQLSLTFTATTTDASAHTVYLYASDTGFLSGGLGTLTSGGTQPGSGNSVEGGFWGGSSNSNLDLTNLIATTGSVGGTPFAVTATGELNPAVTPFGLTIGVRITRGSAGTSTGDVNGTMTPVPLPAAAWLLCSGLAAMGALARRRRVKSSKA